MNLLAPALILIASISLIIWITLVFYRGGFWRADQRLSSLKTPLLNPPSVVAIIPARNEEDTIGLTIDSLLNQQYSGEFSIILVNDNSDDKTVEVAKIEAKNSDRVTIIEGVTLPDGWTGKMWAVAQGIKRAKQTYTDAKYYLLTDADILHDPNNLAELMTKALDENLSLVSLMVRLRCETVWERLLMPAFVLFFQKLYPFTWVNNPKKKTAGAAGGCMLVHAPTLEEAGGIKSIKNAVIDDCALAHLIKKSDSIWLGLSGTTTSLRKYEKLSDIWQMVCRTAYVQLDYSPLQLFGTIVGMLTIYVAPVVSLITGLVMANLFLLMLGLVPITLMLIIYVPTLKLYGRPYWEAGLLPIAAMLYTAMTLDSARRYMSSRTPVWKGRSNQLKHKMNMEDTKLNPIEEVKEIVKQSGTSFYWAMRTLPAKKRDAMFAIYAFCREVDDIADGKESTDSKREKLSQWRMEISNLFDRNPGNSITRALLDPVATFDLKQQDFEAVIDGMEMDAVDSLRIIDIDELALYCDRVACAVGRMSNAVFGLSDESNKHLAKSLGEALQLTNILRDICEDADRDHVYLPSDILARHGIDGLSAKRIVEHPNVIEVCTELAERTERDYLEASKIIKQCQKRRIRPAIIMMAIYQQIFRRLQRRGWDRLDQPVKVSKLWKLMTAVRIFVFNG